MREKKFKKRNIPKFPIHYYTKIAAKTGTHDKIILFFASKRGTVPPKEEQLASMPLVVVTVNVEIIMLCRFLLFGLISYSGIFRLFYRPTHKNN